jgi:hypothetical protein
VFALAFAVSADASTIEGTSLAIKNSSSGSNRLVFKSLTEISVNSGNFGSDGDPLCSGFGGGGASLRINGGGANDFTIDLPCAGWITTNGSPENIFNTDYLYEDPSGATCKRVVVRHGRTLTAICEGPQVAYVLDGPQGNIDLTLRLGTMPLLNCATLGPPPTIVRRDGSNGRKYLARNSPDPDSCTSP